MGRSWGEIGGDRERSGEIWGRPVLGHLEDNLLEAEAAAHGLPHALEETPPHDVVHLRDRGRSVGAQWELSRRWRGR